MARARDYVDELIESNETSGNTRFSFKSPSSEEAGIDYIDIFKFNELYLAKITSYLQQCTAFKEVDLTTCYVPSGRSGNITPDGMTIIWKALIQACFDNPNIKSVHLLVSNGTPGHTQYVSLRDVKYRFCLTDTFITVVDELSRKYNGSPDKAVVAIAGKNGQTFNQLTNPEVFADSDITCDDICAHIPFRPMDGRRQHKYATELRQEKDTLQENVAILEQEIERLKDQLAQTTTQPPRYSTLSTQRPAAHHPSTLHGASGRPVGSSDQQVHSPWCMQSP